VDVGLVDGTIAATTTNGPAISVNFVASYRFLLTRFPSAAALNGAVDPYNPLRREEVLLDLAGDDAKACFFVGEPRKFLGARTRSGGDGVDDAIDLGLGEFREDRGGALGALDKRPDFGDRCLVFVGKSGRISCGRGGERHQANLTPTTYRLREPPSAGCARRLRGGGESRGRP